MALPLSLRRIFRQVRNPGREPVRGADLGFTGMAARVPIDDDYRADALRAPRGSEQRLWAARDFFMKRHCNAVRLADQHDDPELREQLAAIREALADHLVVVAHQVRNVLEELGYDTAARDRGDEAGLEAADGSGLPALTLVRDWAPKYDDDHCSRGTATEEGS
jgi:hypothetical protein